MKHLTPSQSYRRAVEEFDEEFCKVFPDGSSRFLRSVSEDSDKEIKQFLQRSYLSLLDAVRGK